MGGISVEGKCCEAVRVHLWRPQISLADSNRILWSLTCPSRTRRVGMELEALDVYSKPDVVIAPSAQAIQSRGMTAVAGEAPQERRYRPSSHTSHLAAAAEEGLGEYRTVEGLDTSTVRLALGQASE